MTVDTGHVRRRSEAAAVIGVPQSTTKRRADAAPDSPSALSGVTWSRVARDRYEVTRAGRTLGFIDIEGGVFVALAGPRYDRAVEASQALRFDDAVRALADRHPPR